MIVVLGRLRVDPADRDAYVEYCRAAVRSAREAPGCLDFAVSADAVEPWRVNVAERWTDADSRSTSCPDPRARVRRPCRG